MQPEFFENINDTSTTGEQRGAEARAVAMDVVKCNLIRAVDMCLQNRPGIHDVNDDSETRPIGVSHALSLYSGLSDAHTCIPPKYRRSAYNSAKCRQSNTTKTCQLWGGSVLFVMPTSDVSVATDNDVYKACDDTQKQHIWHAVEELQNKSASPWDKRAPLHTCATVSTQHLRNSRADINVCDERNGMGHCQLFEALMSQQYTVPMNYHVLGESVHVDTVSVAYPYEVQQSNARMQSYQQTALSLGDGEIIQDSVTVRLISGTHQFLNLGDMPVRYTVRFVVLQQLYFCPNSPPARAVHDCTEYGCVHYDPYTGNATCSMTNLVLEVSSAMCLRDKYAKLNGDDGYSYSRRDAYDLRVSVVGGETFQRKPPVDRVDIENCVELQEDLEHYADQCSDDEDADKNPDAPSSSRRHAVCKSTQNSLKMTREHLHSLVTRRSGRYVRNRRSATRHVRTQLRQIREHSEEAQKMLNTGHISSHTEYVEETEYRMRKLIGYDDVKMRHAMTCVLTMQLFKSKGGVNMPRDSNNCRTLKWYTIPEKEAEMRANAERAMSRDKCTTVQVKIIRDRKVITKIIDEHIRNATRKCVLFWTLLRMRTDHARRAPGDFSITAFSVAFLYLMRAGITVTVNKRERIIVSKNQFFRHALPDMEHIGEISHLFNLRFVRRCMKNISRVVNEHCVTQRNAPESISPESVTNRAARLDSINSKHPDLFVGIKRNRNKQR